MATAIQNEASPWLQAAVVPSLRSSFSWTLAGNIVYSACQWGILVALAKFGSPELVGRFALALAVTAPVFMLANLQLRGVQATDTRSEFAFADYFTLRTLASLTGLVVVCMIVLAGRYDWTTGAVIVLVGLSKAIESLSDVIAGLLQKAERLDRVAISLMIRGVFSLLAFGIAFWRFRSLIAAAAAMIVVWLSVLVFYDLRQARAFVQRGRGFFAFRWARLRALALVSAPLGVVMTLGSLNANIPRYLLERSLGPSELGIFASLAYLLVGINLVVGALGQSVVSRLARMFAEGDSERFRKVLVKLIAFASLIMVLGVPLAMLVGRPLLTLAYRPEYGQHVSLFVLMTAAAGVSSIASFLGYGMTAARAFRMQVPVIGASTLATVLFSVLLIPRHGSGGAACALFIGACVQAGYSAAVLRLAMHERVS
jgi:O-antigen/teichoic acid export membrane protein